MLVPMFFLIALWGHERRVYAAIKFFLFTQVGGLLMLVAILALVFVHGRADRRLHFRLPASARHADCRATATWLMLGFFAAFAVKLPAVPLHTWLPDAHTQAPTAGSRDARRPAAQDRRLRLAPLHGAAVPAGRVPRRAGGHGASP